MDGEDSLANLRVASFSCYLNTKEESIVLKIGNAIQAPDSAVISNEDNPCPISLARTKSKEEELNIFGADKYFNMKMDYDNTARLADHHRRKLRFVREDDTELHPMKPKATPCISTTATSEASHNSQTSWLPNLMRNQSQTNQKKAAAKRFFIGFNCSGPCSDNKAVCIDETAENGVIHGAKHSQPGSKRGEQFAFPVLNSGIRDVAVKKEYEEVKLDEEELRKSLEVFGSDIMKDRDDVAAKLERKLSMLTWDAIPKSQSLPPTNFGSSLMSDDMASDASSDLFEIENISGSGYAVLTRQASDNMSGCMTPTTQYAPSEASIEWSVVTGSAADFSVASDYDGVSTGGDLIARNANSLASKTKNSAGKEAQKSRSSGMLGCKSYKAVEVAEPAHKSIDKANQQGPLDSSLSFRKSQPKYIEHLRAKQSLASRGRSPQG